MMNNVPDVVRHFLDIEAQVDNEEEDDRYGDGPPGELILVYFYMSAINLFVF